MPETIGEAFVSIRADDSKFKSDVNTLGGTLTGFAKTAGTAIAAVGIGAFFKSAIGEAQEAQKVSAQTAAVIKSTGGAANVSAGQVDTLANSLSQISGIDDEVIASGENMLLTFTNIRNEVGKGNDIFDQATKAALDMSVALGEDLQSASIQVGKALQDPVAGVTALQRVGVRLTDTQKALVAQLVATGDTMGAQKVILAELTKEFGGSAEAQATGLDKAKVAWKNFEEQIGTAIAPAVETATSALTGLLGSLEEVGAATIVTSTALGAMIGLRFGGPTGAAVGAVAGAFLGLASGLKLAEDHVVTFGERADAVFGNFAKLSSDKAAQQFLKDTTKALADAEKEAQASNDVFDQFGIVIESSANNFNDFHTILTKTTVQFALFQKLAERDPALAQQIINGLKARGVETGRLEFALRKVLDAEREHADAQDQVNLSQDELIRQGAEFVTTLQKQEQGVRNLQNALLAAQGGELGYRAAVNSAEDAQADFNAAVGLFGPNSEEADRAAIRLEQANLAVASAAFTLVDQQKDLNELVSGPTPTALEIARQKLVDFQTQYGDTTGAVQAQIDKTDEAITKWHELHDLPDIQKLIEFDYQTNILTPETSGQTGIPGSGTTGNPDLDRFLATLPHAASGGWRGPGPLVVGESGPELLSLAKPAYVTPSDQLSRAGAVHNYYIDAAPKDALALAMELALRQRVATLVS